MNSKWMRLDNAALIFPAVRSHKWVNTFRVSVTLSEDVDADALQAAADDLLPRFPSIYVRLGRGLFWYYLEALEAAPRVMEDFAYPLTHMTRREQRRCCFRILRHRNRIAVEFFHVLTDGTGGMIYLKSLTARYLERRYGVSIPRAEGVLGPEQAPLPEETEDAFHRFAGPYALSRAERSAYRLSGTLDTSGFMHLTCGVVPTSALLEAAHRCGATVTVFLCAVLTQAVAGMQAAHVPRERWKPVKITVPVNLRRLFGANTLRNFALVLNPGVDPRLAEYTVEQLCREYRNQLALEYTPEKMAARIAANVIPQRLLAMRLAPLFLKNAALRAVYSLVGERKGCLNVSNLGAVKTPPEMERYVRRFDFIIGVQLSYPNNCSVASYGDVTCINMIRSIRETELERRFFSRLVELGVPVLVESNDPVAAPGTAAGKE